MKKQKPGKKGDGGGISDDRGERHSKAVVAMEERTSARREEVTRMDKEPGKPQPGPR